MKLVAIKKIASTSKRYDLQTQAENYFANGVLVHNSIIKLFNRKYTWRLATNGTIDAEKTTVPIGKSFYELFMTGAEAQGLDFTKLDPNKTYIFELCSPYNKVVVPHKEIVIYHIGTRDNLTFVEENIDIGIMKPKTYPMKTLEDCIAVAKDLPFSEEGYVVVDANWRRVKIKSPAYVSAHRLVNNNSVTETRILDIILQGEDAEFLIAFPEYKADFDAMWKRINQLFMDFDYAYVTIQPNWARTRKEFAMEALKYKTVTALLFMAYDGKLKMATLKDYLWSLTPEKLLRML